MTLPARAGRRVNGTVENTWEAVENALRPLVQTDEGAQEVASAFYDVAWVSVALAVQTYDEAHDHAYEHESGGVFVCSWRSAGGMVADLRGRGENYMDWCYDAQSQVISDRVRAAMAALGLRPVV